MYFGFYLNLTLIDIFSDRFIYNAFYTRQNKFLERKVKKINREERKINIAAYKELSRHIFIRLLQARCLYRKKS